MARRGFLALIIHQAQVAAREHERAQRAAVREHNASVRRAERARKASERLQAQLERSAEAERRQLERESKEAHIALRLAETEEQNLKLNEIYDAIDSLLSTTLEIDDYVNLETFRVVVEHPPFDRPDLEVPISKPTLIPDPPQPTASTPEPPKGLSRLIGMKRYASALAKAEEDHKVALAQWRRTCEQRAMQRRAAEVAHAEAEAKRIAQLEAERAKYAEECEARRVEAEKQNTDLDKLITDLSYGVAEAVQEYVSIVLSNSVYPQHFPVTHDFQFDPVTAELRLMVLLPGPDTIPNTKAYKYIKATDSVSTTALSQKSWRDRYANAVHQVALRSLHEVFEADRRGLIRTIALEVGLKAVDPGTGRQTYVPLVGVGIGRESFLEFDLRAVIPKLALDRLGAVVSKNPSGLVPVEISGVRRS